MRAEALAAVAKQLEGEERRSVLVEALAAARSIGDERSRGEALVAVAGGMMEDKRPWAPRSTTRGATSPVDDAATVAEGRQIHGYLLVARLLDIAGSLPRWRLLQIVQTIAPAVAALGGAPAIRETTDAIRDSTRWWP